MAGVFLEIVALLKPQVVMWENVPCAARPVKQPNGKSHIGLAEILYGLTLLRYQWRVSIDNSARHGVPQARHRLIVIGTKLNLTLPVPPAATHQSDAISQAKLDKVLPPLCPSLSPWLP